MRARTVVHPRKNPSSEVGDMQICSTGRNERGCNVPFVAEFATGSNEWKTGEETKLLQSNATNECTNGGFLRRKSANARRCMWTRLAMGMPPSHARFSNANTVQTTYSTVSFLTTILSHRPDAIPRYNVRTRRNLGWQILVVHGRRNETRPTPSAIDLVRLAVFPARDVHGESSQERSS